MAGFNFTYEEEITLTGPKTVAQFLAPTNQRVKLKRIELQPGGSTGASAPLQFDLGLQDGAGTSSDDSANLQKSTPVAAETIQTTVRNAFTAEPSTTTPKDSFTLHQQGARTWVPVGGELIIEGNTRLGFRLITAASTPVKVRFHLEE